MLQSSGQVSKFGAVLLLVLVAGAVYAIPRPRFQRKAAVVGARVVANERMTALDGALLYLMFLAIAITILFIRGLLELHFLVGVALVPPLGLKLLTTGQRFLRYYAGDRDFRLAGPPPALLRFVVAPVLVASTIGVMGSGLELWAFADRFGGWWVTAHTLSAAVFMPALLLHLLAHMRRSAVAAVDEVTAARDEGAGARRSLLVGCAILACVLALASLSYATPFGSFGGG
jgi:hypothetical protein